MQNKPQKTNVFFKVVLIIAIIIVFLIAASFVLLSLMNRKPRAAFYGISEKTRNVIVQNLQRTSTRRNNQEPYEIIVLDDTISLSDSLKKNRKIDILFIHDGFNAEYAYNFATKKNFGFIKDEILSGMTSSIRAVAPDYKDSKFKNGIPEVLPEKERNELLENNRLHTKVAAVPILSDNSEIDVNYGFFNESEVGKVDSFTDLEKIAEYAKGKVNSPVLIAAGDDDCLINVYGALTESLSGIESWQNAVDEIKKAAERNASLSVVAENLVKEGKPFYEANELLKSWIKNGYLAKNVSQFTKRDIKAFASLDQAAIIFMTLEEHRTYETSTISKYSSIYYPSNESGIYRSFSSPTIMAVPMSKNEAAHESIKKLSNDLQQSLSFGTGLAPTQSQCAIPDRQADDARYWIAASQSPVPLLTDAAFLNKDQKTAFANQLRSELR